MARAGRPGEETLVLPEDTRSGHSSLTVTTDVYGHWERAEHKREAALMEGIFGV